MCDKFFESVGVSEDLLFAGGGCVNLIHQVGETVEGGWLAHFMLAQFFRKYSKVDDNPRAILILNQHSKTHWVSIGNKLGLNISSLEEKGSLTVIDVMKDTFKALRTNQDKDNCLCLYNLFNRTYSIIQNFKNTPATKVLIIVDDLTNHFCLDPNRNLEKETVQFLMKLRALSVNNFETSLITTVGIVNSSSDSFELTRCAQTIVDAFSSVTFEVSPLSTGFSAQVSGFLKVTCNPQKIVCEKRLESAFTRSYHFKLENNSARAIAL